MVKRLCEPLQFNYAAPAPRKWESISFTKLKIRLAIPPVSAAHHRAVSLSLPHPFTMKGNLTTDN